MAYTTESSYTGNGSTTEFLVTFPFLESTDIKARVNGVDTSAFTVTGTTVTFNTAPPNTQAVLLYRNTDIDKTKVVFHAGSSIRAQDLNNTSKQLLYAIQEEEQSTGGVAFDTGNKGQITVSSANNWVINNGVVTEPMMAANSVDSDQYVDGSIDNIHLANLSVSTGKIQDDAVTADKLANSINTEIAANTAKVTNATHTGEVTGATALTIADNIVDEANLKVDNTPTNDQILTAKSSASGGLTWAASTNPNPTKFATLSDVKSQNTVGGAYGTANVWVTRTLNTEVDPDGIVSLSSNQFTLGRGRYLIQFSAPGFEVTTFHSRLYDVTNSAERALGNSQYANESGWETPFYSCGAYAVNLTGDTTFRVEFIAAGNANSADGALGIAANISGVSEVYTTVQITKSDNPA